MRVKPTIKLLAVLAVASGLSGCATDSPAATATNTTSGNTAASQGAAKVFNVRDFGAVGDGKTLDTAAIQKALDACGAAGGGTVRLPAGTYLSRPITMVSQSTLQLDADAVLKATDNFGDFLRPGLTWTNW